MLALRACLDEDDGNARRIARYVIGRAIAGHVGFFRYVLDTIDGPIRSTSQEELTGEADCVVVVADDRREAEPAKAA